jgi:hypothetical protein
VPHDVQADLCIRAGYLSLRRIGDFFGVAYDPDPHFPEAAISITRADYDAACRHGAALTGRAGVRIIAANVRAPARSQGGGEPVHMLLQPRRCLGAGAVAATVLVASCGPQPTSTPEPTRTPAAPTIVFLSKDRTVQPGSCTTLEWETTGARQVYLDGRGVEPMGEQEVCPGSTTTFTLGVISADGTETSRTVTIDVPVVEPTAAPTEPPTAVPPTAVPVTRPPAATATPAPTATAAVSVNFYGRHGGTIPADQLCTELVWETQGVTDVALQVGEKGSRKAVGASGSEEACFEGELKAYLYYKLPNGTEESRELVIKHEEEDDG